MYNEIDLDKIDLNAQPPTEETARQYYFMAKCREWVKDFERKNGRLPRSCVVNMGCQMNARDSEKMAGILRAVGYEETDRQEEADLVLFNTCTVRENANLKLYGHLGQLKTYKKKNPGMLILLCGCMMQEQETVGRIRSKYRHVDIIFGTHNIFKLAELLFLRLSDTSGERRMIVDIWRDTQAIVEDLPSRRKYPFKSGVNIMFGCDNFCSYCIVPYVRGRERSRSPEDILREIGKLAGDGVSEIMLLGQNVNSYGKNLEHPVSFAELLQRVEQVDGIERIRFMTSHPKDLSEELIGVMARSEKICRHLHLPLQSGSSRLLRIMNRHYTKEGYLALVEKIRAAIPDISLTTDIIVGFPGETEQDFEETMDVVGKAEFDSAFTFLYSRRTGTPAADMAEQVPDEVARERFGRLLKRVQDISAAKTAQGVGRTERVLVEEVNKKDASLVTGRTEKNYLVHFPGDASLIGQIVPVTLCESKGFYYYGNREEEYGKRE